MVAQYKDNKTNISLVDAVETLSNIADLELEREIGVTQKHDLIIQGKSVTYRTVHWLEKVDPVMTMDRVKDIFRVVLNYLHNFYKQEYRYVGNKKALEGVKAIMVLVGEAAKKLDRYTTLFQGKKAKSVVNLKEYKELQEFYLTRIARKIDEGTLGKWILGLTKVALARKKIAKLVGKKTTNTKRVFIDLDSVKKDTEYELFYLRKEDGNRFFSPRLIRNVKLVCDFGQYFGARKGDDPLASVQIWQDRLHHDTAENIIQSLGSSIDWFYQDATKFKKREMVVCLNKSLMALMLCANARNQLRNNPAKSSLEYFNDFQVFLRDAMQTRDYEKMVAYPKKRSSKLAHSLLDLAHRLCRALFVNTRGYQELIPTIQHVIEEAEESQSPEHEKAVEEVQHIWSRLASDYAAMGKLIKRHPGGPLLKVLELLEEGIYHVFEPVRQHNIPGQLYSLYYQEHKITNVRLPSPTEQEFIHLANVIEEFKGFLRSYVINRSKRKHLLVNFQDRTSWREHFRCRALEELQNVRNFAPCFAVITIPKDTEFYNQQAPYHQENHADVFIKHLKEQLIDEHCGFYFPELIKKEITSEFVDGVIETIHRIFFNGKNVLSRKQRLDFIEIFYMLLQLKLIEIVKPDSFSLTCKDGIDISGAANTQLYAFLKIINNEAFTSEDIEHLDLILYAPSLLNRERNMLPDRFNRMISVLRTIEHVRDEFGGDNFSAIVKEAFSLFYKTPILQSMLILPKK